MPENLAQQYIASNSDPAAPVPTKSLPTIVVTADRLPPQETKSLPPIEVVADRLPPEETKSLPSIVVTADREIVRDAPEDQTYLTNKGADKQNFGFTRKAPVDEEVKSLPEVVVTADREPDEEVKKLPKPPDVVAELLPPEEVIEQKTLPTVVVNADIEEEPQPPVTPKFPKSVNDWRVKLSLAPNSKYLYNQADAGILAPLQNTGGVIFPYTPQVSVNYSASYDQTDLTHSNYRIYQYRGSNVGEITIQGDFTAQDTVEANYLLAVIHFFKSATKMFYGKDTEPKPGTPPPLCFLSGYGLYQFNNNPLVISSFTYTLPNDVDYIRAGSATMVAGENFGFSSRNNSSAKQTSNSLWSKLVRMSNSGVTSGAMKSPPSFSSNNLSANENTYVPTKMTINITCLPIVTRKDVSDSFSLNEYSKGKLWGMW